MGMHTRTHARTHARGPRADSSNARRSPVRSLDHTDREDYSIWTGRTGFFYYKCPKSKESSRKRCARPFRRGKAWRKAR